MLNLFNKDDNNQNCNFRLKNIGKIRGHQFTLLSNPVFRWLSLSNRHCWISSIIVESTIDFHKKDSRSGCHVKADVPPTCSRPSTSGNVAYPSAQIRRNEIITKCETDFLYTSIVELPRWVIIVWARNDDDFRRTSSVIQLATIVLWNVGRFPYFCTRDSPSLTMFGIFVLWW